MSDIAIKVQNLSKRRKIGAWQQGYKTFRVQLSFAVAEKGERSGQGTSAI